MRIMDNNRKFFVSEHNGAKRDIQTQEPHKEAGKKMLRKKTQPHISANEIREKVAKRPATDREVLGAEVAIRSKSKEKTPDTKPAIPAQLSEYNEVETNGRLKSLLQSGGINFPERDRSSLENILKE